MITDHNLDMCEKLVTLLTKYLRGTYHQTMVNVHNQAK